MRVAQATTLQLLAEFLRPEDVLSLFALLITGGALGDQDAQVRNRLLEVGFTIYTGQRNWPDDLSIQAGVAAIDLHGKANLQPLIAIFEGFLAKPSSPTEEHDRITESVVILFGRLARHLDPSDERIATVVARLVDALKTPSELVQAAVSDCLPPLVAGMKAEAPKLMDQLLFDAMNAKKYAERRGAAYGLAGAVKGRGISSLKEQRVISGLKDALEEKKNIPARQGALFITETLTMTLGRLFEPYLIQLLPLLLSTFGDSSPDVREATQDAAKVIMSKIRYADLASCSETPSDNSLLQWLRCEACLTRPPLGIRGQAMAVKERCHRNDGDDGIPGSPPVIAVLDYDHPPVD